MTSQLAEGLAPPILGIDVELDINTGLTVGCVDFGDLGCSLQLNGYSPQGTIPLGSNIVFTWTTKPSTGKSRTGLPARMPILTPLALFALAEGSRP